MLVRKLEIKGFGKLRELKLDLSEGFNLIYGNNESGKTSVQWFIKSVLFGVKGGRTGRDGSLPSSRKFSPWAGGDYQGSIEYCLDNGESFRAVRNFENNSVKVFDSQFNDISGTFEMSRDRGALFSEKQLGITEALFERTVFIKQMGSRVDDDGSRELLNRLINITETGYEDVSFKKAQEALKSALKNHIGTDKTYTRPLDRLIGRLQELGSVKEDLVRNRNSLFSLEKDLNNAILIRKHLTARKEALEKVRGVVQASLETDTERKLGTQIREILERINIWEEDLSTVKNSILDFNSIREELNRFSAYTSEDAETIGIQYNKLLSLMREKGRLEVEAASRQDKLTALEMQLEPLKAFTRLDENVQDEVLKLNRELEFLKREKEKVNLDAVSEKTVNQQKKYSKLRYAMLASSLITAMLALAAFLYIPSGVARFVGIASVLAGLVSTLMLVFAKFNAGRELSLLQKEKEMKQVLLDNLHADIEKKRNKVSGIYNSAGAEDLEEFLTLKALFDSKTQHITLLNTEMDVLEIKLRVCSDEIEELKGAIIRKLAVTGVLEDSTNDISPLHIQDFKNGIRRYLGLIPSIDYSRQRAAELDRDLKSRYRYVSTLCGKDCFSKEDIEAVLEGIDERLERSEEYLCSMTASIREQYVNNGISGTEFLELEKRLSEADLGSLKTEFDFEYDKTLEKLNNAVLQIKEYEILSKSLNSDGYDLQRVDEEIAELKARKNHLEDINISLKLALDVLEESCKELQKDFVPALNSGMSSVMKKITGGRYTDMRADNNLSLKVVSPDTGDVAGVFSLSGGTVDQMYLAMRIALAGLITGTDETLPLFLDEILAQYDDTRTRDTLEFLHKLSQERQVVFFTCKGREVEIARSIMGRGVNVINL